MFELNKEELELKKNVEQKKIKAIELAEQLCSLFQLEYRVKGWQHNEYCVELMPDNYGNNFEIRTNGKTTYFVDATRTGQMPSWKGQPSFLPKELYINHVQSNDSSYRREWEEKTEKLLGIRSTFSGNSGYGPHFYMSFPITKEYSRNIMELIKAKGVKLRIV